MKLAVQSKNKMFNFTPTRIIVLSFALIILTGSLLLTLPIASRSGKSIGFLNALFTATSATCVTGLVVVDTYTHWTLFGQLVILVLIQAGGLGIVTLATFFSVLLGRKVGLKGMILAQESINNFSFAGVLRVVKRVVLVTFAFEAAGALLLTIRFIPRFGLKGIYYGIFHSISAFCNAGFDLMGNFRSLTEYNDDPIVLYTMAGLIVVGGLGFTVWKDLFEYRKSGALNLHTKVVLIMVALLISFGFVFFFISEYSNPLTMGSLNTHEKINAAFFHSVTTRTAGFNTLDLNGMHEISKVATVLLMFIGAAPGSTGGGMKVTTLGVILMAIISQVKGSDDTIILRRRVPHYIINKALAIMGLGLFVVILVTTILLGIEKGFFIDSLYEATSAFATVGLSTGMTTKLEPISKMLIILTMFLGRVGPLTFAISLALRSKKNKDVVYPEGKIMVG